MYGGSYNVSLLGYLRVFLDMINFVILQLVLYCESNVGTETLEDQGPQISCKLQGAQNANGQIISHNS
jgi:hypothetical protein